MSRVEELAYRMADASAWMDIESCTLDAEGARSYYDTASADDDDKSVVAEAVEYLDLRGLIERHPDRRTLIRWKR